MRRRSHRACHAGRRDFAADFTEESGGADSEARTIVRLEDRCPARRPLRTNTLFFQTRQEAEKEGYRPCRRCKPDTIPASVLVVKRAAQVLENEVDGPVNVNTLARKVGVRTDALRRAFRQQTGLNPKELAAALRLKRFKQLLRSGSSIAENSTISG